MVTPTIVLTVDEQIELLNMLNGNGWGYPLPGTSRVVWEALDHLCELGLARVVKAVGDPRDELGAMFWYVITLAGRKILKETQ